MSQEDETVNINAFYKPRNLTLAVGIVSIVLLGAFAAWWVSAPSWVPMLNSELDAQTRTEIQNHLMEWSIPFREDPSNQNILIQEQHIIEVRNRLSGMGIPRVSHPGLEIFNESEYGMSEFSQRINFQRAIEAEIANTIRSYHGVRSARVHLTIPKESIFSDKNTDPKAAVSIQLSPNEDLNPQQILGIRQLVASSVDKLSPDKVVVLNDNGELIDGGQNKDYIPANFSQEKLDEKYANQAFDLAYGVAQTDNIKIAVNLQYNYDKVHSIKEEVIPALGTDSGFLAKTRQNKTSETNAEDENSTVNKNTTIEQEYVFTKERSEIEYAAGKIEKIGIGVVIAKELSDESIKQIEQLIASGLGLDKQRGDNIVVVSAPPFVASIDLEGNQESLPFPKPSPESNKQSDTFFAQQTLPILMGIFITLLLIAAISIINKNKTRRGEETPKLSEQDRILLLADLRNWVTEK